jgi:hypothetical protein
MGTKLAAVLVVFVVALGAGAYFGLEHKMRGEAEKRTNELVGRLAPFIDVTYDSVRVDVFRWRSAVRGLTVTSLDRSVRVKIAQAEVRRFDDENHVPHFLHVVVLDGITFENRSRSPADVTPNTFGYNADVVAAAEVAWEYAKGELKLDPFILRAKDAGGLTARLHLANVDFSDIAKVIDKDTPFLVTLVALGVRLQQVLVHRVELEYQDDSFLARALMAQANSQGKPLPTVRCEMSTLIERWLDDLEQTFGVAPTFSPEAQSVVRNGFDHPLKVIWTLAPKKPVPLARMMRARDDKEMADLLNFKVQVEAVPGSGAFVEPRFDSVPEPQERPVENLERYYAVYSSPYVKRVREVMNGFLKGRHDGIWTGGDVLKNLEDYRRYLDGPFVVMNIADAPFGGKELIIAFQDRPVRLFNLWVYMAGDDLELRMFSELEKPPVETAGLLCGLRQFVKDRKHAL